MIMYEKVGGDEGIVQAEEMPYLELWMGCFVGSET